MNCNASIDPSCIAVFDSTIPVNTNQTFENVTSPLNQTNQTLGSQTFDSNIFGGNLFRVGYPSIIAIIVALVGLVVVMKYGGVGKKVDNTLVSAESIKEGEDVKSDTRKDK